MRTQFLDHTSRAETVRTSRTIPGTFTRKYGFGVNVEQNLARYVTAYARWGWTTANRSRFAYTRSIRRSTGVGVNGALWHRTQDRAGTAFVSMESRKIIRYIWPMAALDFCWATRLNMDGRTSLETYYTVHVWRGIYVAPGVQHINDPGYNRDRGPVVCRRCGARGVLEQLSAISYQLSSEMH